MYFNIKIKTSPLPSWRHVRPRSPLLPWPFVQMTLINPPRVRYLLPWPNVLHLLPRLQLALLIQPRPPYALITRPYPLLRQYLCPQSKLLYVNWGGSAIHQQYYTGTLPLSCRSVLRHTSGHSTGHSWGSRTSALPYNLHCLPVMGYLGSTGRGIPTPGCRFPSVLDRWGNTVSHGTSLVLSGTG